jgi:hypothetical protein
VLLEHSAAPPALVAALAEQLCPQHSPQQRYLQQLCPQHSPQQRWPQQICPQHSAPEVTTGEHSMTRFLLSDNTQTLHVNPGSESYFNLMKLSRDRAQQCIDDAFDYAKQRWDASHTPPSFKVGDQVLVSTQHFGFSGPRKLHEHFAGPFPITRLIGDNAIEVTLTGEYARKHPVFPVSLCKKYREANPEQFPNCPTPPPPAPDIIDDESEWEVERILDERTIKKARGRIEREYHVRWKGYDSSHDLWLPEENLAHSKAAIRAFRLSQRNEKSQNTSPLNDD